MTAPSGAVFFIYTLMTKTPLLVENVDYVINDEGNLVFTAHYLLKRGHCCQSGCLNCPYGYKDKVDPNVPAEFMDSWETHDLSFDDEEDE